MTEPAPPPLRRLLAQGSGVLIALVLLKWLGLEVCHIPSPSMQPLLLGSRAAGLHDRVLVDRLTHLLRAPRRWEVLAFRSPQQRRQLVAKRCVGLPGERLRLGGGNAYVVDAGAPRGRRVLRKPDAVQEQTWREIHPLRQQVRGGGPLLGTTFAATPASAWREDEGGVLTAGGMAGADQLLILTDPDGGLVDRAWDGHPPEVAATLRAAALEWQHRLEIVPDAKIACTVDAASTPDAIELTLTVRRPAHRPLSFALLLSDGVGRLGVREGDDPAVEVGAGEPFPFPLAGPLASQGAVELAFAHVDDELIAWRGGAVVARLDTAAWPCDDGCELPPGPLAVAGPPAGHRVELRIRVRSPQAVTLADLRILRDLHYTRGALAPAEVVEVPAGHYFVLGDNPPQSEDSRGWPMVELGVDAAGGLVPAATAGAVRRRGALRLGNPEQAPAADENPVFVRDRGLALFVDDLGELRRLTLREQVSWHFGPLQIGEGAATWEPATTTLHFVPRGAVVGRVIARIYPVPPFGPWRPGWVR